MPYAGQVGRLHARDVQPNDRCCTTLVVCAAAYLNNCRAKARFPGDRAATKRFEADMARIVLQHGEANSEGQLSSVVQLSSLD